MKEGHRGARTRSRGGAESRRDRGQTTLDYAVGIGIFILAVVFVVTFIPSMFEPFATGTQENTVAADRVATQLVTGALTSPETPYSLSVACLTDFFDDTDDGSTPAGCAFQDVGSIANRVGLSSRQPVNVTVRGDLNDDGSTDLLCRTPSGVVTERDTATLCDTLYAGGDSPAGAETVTVARRMVTFTSDTNTHTAMLEVRLWG